MPIKTVDQELERLKRNKNTYAQSLTIVHNNVKDEVKAALQICDKNSPEAICLGKYCYFTFNTGSRCNFCIAVNPVPRSALYFVVTRKQGCDNMIIDLKTYQELTTSLDYIARELSRPLLGREGENMLQYAEGTRYSLSGTFIGILRLVEEYKRCNLTDINVNEFKKRIDIITSIFSHAEQLETIF